MSPVGGIDYSGVAGLGQADISHGSLLKEIPEDDTGCDVMVGAGVVHDGANAVDLDKMPLAGDTDSCKVAALV